MSLRLLDSSLLDRLASPAQCLGNLCDTKYAFLPGQSALCSIGFAKLKLVEED